MVSQFVYDIIDKYVADERLRSLLILHSVMVAEKAKSVAREAGVADRIDMQFLEDAAMLHDIGIVATDAPAIFCYGEQPYIRHGVEGARILAEEGIPEKYQRVCSRHTGSGLTAKEIEERQLPLPHEDLVPETLEEKIICYADKFFSKTGNPAREKDPEHIERSMMKHGEDALRRFYELRDSIYQEP